MTGSVARDRAVLVARLIIGLYLVELLLNLVRPHALPHEPVLSIFQKLPGNAGSLGRLLSMPVAVFWIVIAGIVIGAALQGYAAISHPEGRRAAVLMWATLAVLLGPFGLISLTVVLTYPLAALACVPSTVFVLWLLHNGQRFARVTLPVLLAAFGWGALMVFSLGRAFSGLAYGTLYGFLGNGSTSDLGAITRSLYRMIDYIVVHLSVVNELAVAAGVILLLLLFRPRAVDVMTGLVFGAAIGLGYSFVESILFIQVYGSLGGIINGATGGFEYWIRQSIGLLGGQVTFGALLGAGISLAFQATGSKQRRFAAGAAIVTAIGGAVASEILSGWFSRLVHDHVSSGGALDTLVISPLLWLLPQVPFIALAVVLLVAGRRARSAAARTAISAEAAAGEAITDREAPFLADPSLRLWTVVSTWRRHGRAAARTLHRLQSAQLDLAAWHWQRQLAGSADDQPVQEEGDTLRAKVIRLKTASGARPVTTP